MLKTEFYVCPICGNVIFSIGETFASCHGIILIKEEATENEIDMELIEDEVYI